MILVTVFLRSFPRDDDGATRAGKLRVDAATSSNRHDGMIDRFTRNGPAR
jgi:hypothetical protein